MLYRKGISSVYGFVALFFLVITSIYAIVQLTQSQNDLNNALIMQQYRIQEKNNEFLTLSESNNTLFVSNRGSFVSNLAYLVIVYNNTSRLVPVNISLYPGSQVSFPLASNVINAGIITSLGNTFMLDQTSINCKAGQSTVTVNVNPSGSGYTNPYGTVNFCKGQTLELQAFPNQGYSFYSWSGSVNSSSNPLFINLNGSYKIQANFLAQIRIDIYPEADGFSYGSKITRYADIFVYGPAEKVTLNAQDIPNNVVVSFNPSSIYITPSGSHSTMSVTYLASSYDSNITFSVVASGQFGTAVSKYIIVQTPNDYLSSNGIYAAQIKNNLPTRNHYASSLTWQGKQAFVLFYTAPGCTTCGNPYYGTNDIYYTISMYSPGTLGAYNGWVVNFYDVSYQCSAGVPIDTYTIGNEIIFATTGNIYDPYLTLNIGTFNGNTIYWANTLQQACGFGYDVGGTRYKLVAGQPLSVVQDNEGNIYIALVTADNNGLFHVEVLEMNINQISLYYNNPYSKVYFLDVFVSPGYSYVPAPQLIALSNGYVALDYDSGCSQDVLYLSRDHGQSWSYVGSFSASSYPLCSNNSSGTGIKDTVFFAGINSAGQLSYWEYNTTSGKFYSPSSGLASLGTNNYCSSTSVGNSIVSVACVSQNSLLNVYEFNTISWQLIVNNVQLITSKYYITTLELPSRSYYQVPLIVLETSNNMYMFALTV